MNRYKEIDRIFIQEEDARFEAKRLLQRLPSNLTYHGASHTLDYVYPEAMKLAELEALDDEQQLLIAVTSLFHDTGFIEQYSANEPIGARNARTYVENSCCNSLREGAQIIVDAVLNTNMQTPPKNRFEAIIRDADLSVMGKPDFLLWNQRLRDEVLRYPESGMYPFAVSDQRWAVSQLKFLETHQWFTQAANSMYQKQKEANIKNFKEMFTAVLNS